MSWELIVKQKFSAAHYLQGYQGKCEKLHGHTFEIEVIIAAGRIDRSGISYDFSELKSFLQEILPDHKNLNEEFDFSPSAENLAYFFYNKIRQKYPVKRITIWESADCGATYAEDI